MKSTLIYILPILVLSACSHSDRTEAPASDVELRQKLIGRWRGDSRLPGDIHVQSETVVDSAGGYGFDFTHTPLEGGREANFEGKLKGRDGLFVYKITKDFGGDTL